MDTAPRILVIIPARNEEQRIPKVIRSIRRTLPNSDILVVEDSSTDNTAEVVRSEGAMIVSLPINLGYGGAIRTGFHYALSKKYDYAITIDADGQHEPADLRSIIDELMSGNYDLVIGSRFLGETTYAIPIARRFGMLLFSWITSAVVGKKITDTTCGLMGINSRALPVAAESCATDFPNAELICVLSTKGLKVHEVPIRIHNREGGKSMFTFWKTFYYPFKLLLAISMVLLRTKM